MFESLSSSSMSLKSFCTVFYEHNVAGTVFHEYKVILDHTYRYEVVCIALHTYEIVRIAIYEYEIVPQVSYNCETIYIESHNSDVFVIEPVGTLLHTDLHLISTVLRTASYRLQWTSRILESTFTILVVPGRRYNPMLKHPH